MIDQQRFDEDPCAADLAGGDEAEACQPLQCLGMNQEQPRGGGEIECAHSSCWNREPGERARNPSQGIHVAEDTLRNHSARLAAGHPPWRRQANPASSLDQANTFSSHCSSSQIADLSGPLGQVEPLRHRTTKVFEATFSVEAGSSREANSHF